MEYLMVDKKQAADFYGLLYGVSPSVYLRGKEKEI